MAKRSTENTTTPVFGRLASEVKEDLTPMKEILELNECTFKPQISDIGHHLKTRYNSITNVLILCFTERRHCDYYTIHYAYPYYTSILLYYVEPVLPSQYMNG